MDTNNLITEFYAVLNDPRQAPNWEYFKKYELTDDSILRIKEIGDAIAQFQSQNPLAEKQRQIQLQQMDQLSESGSQSFRVVKQVKDSLNDTLLSSKNAQGITTWMYIFSFCLGMALIISAVVFAAMDKTILAIAFGTFGMVDIVAHFIADPPARLQESRSNYVQLIGLTLAWFKETMNNDACIGMSGQMPKEMLKNYNILSENYVNNTGRFFKMMDDLAEPKARKTKKNRKKEEVPSTVS